MREEKLFRQIQLLVIILASLNLCLAKVSDERLCADPECGSKYILCPLSVDVGLEF